jgi:hypothetical protein
MSDPRLEQQLRSSLARQASDDDPRSPDFGDIVARARGIRRQRNRRVGTALAAAAVVAIVVPTAVVLGSRQGSNAPAPAVTDTPTVSPSTPTSPPTSPSSTPSTPPSSSPATSDSTAAPGAPTYSSLTAIPAGPTTTLTYLDQNGLVHESAGTTARLPGKGTVLSFAVYHGGWLVIDDPSTLRQYDSQGKLLAQGPDGSLAVSGDQMQTAFQTGTTVKAGISTGMGNGEATWRVPTGTSLIGYLKSQPVVSDGTSLWALTGSGGTTKLALPSMAPVALSDSAGLVGGVTGTPAQGNQQGAVADAATGRVLWQNDWEPDAFSSDGTYVAGYPVEDNGEPAQYAILDARTGRTVATTPKLGDKLHLGLSVAWEGDTLVFNAFDSNGGQVLLSLDTSGTLRRVSPIERASNPAGGDTFRFAEQP